MKNFIFIACFTWLICASGQASQIESNADIHFSEKGECISYLIDEIQASKAELLIESKSIPEQLVKPVVDASARGVKITVISSDSPKALQKFQNSGVEIFMDQKHIKDNTFIAVIDGEKIFSSTLGEDDATHQPMMRVLFVVQNPIIGIKVKQHFQIHKQHCVALNKESQHKPAR